MNRTLSSALGAIESTDREAAQREYVEIVKAGVSEDQAIRERATKPETVLKLRGIMATLGKTRADLARDEALIAQFEQDKDVARGLQTTLGNLQQAERDAEAAHVVYEQEVAMAAAKRDAVATDRDKAIGRANAARAAENRCKKILAESPQLVLPEDAEYLMIHEQGSDGKTRVLYQRPKQPTPADPAKAAK